MLTGALAGAWVWGATKAAVEVNFADVLDLLSFSSVVAALSILLLAKVDTAAVDILLLAVGLGLDSSIGLVVEPTSRSFSGEDKSFAAVEMILLLTLMASDLSSDIEEVPE